MGKSEEEITGLPPIPKGYKLIMPQKYPPIPPGYKLTTPQVSTTPEVSTEGLPPIPQGFQLMQDLESFMLSQGAIKPKKKEDSLAQFMQSVGAIAPKKEDSLTQFMQSQGARLPGVSDFYKPESPIIMPERLAPTPTGLPIQQPDLLSQGLTPPPPTVDQMMRDFVNEAILKPGATTLGGFYGGAAGFADLMDCLLYTSPSPRDRTRSRMPSSA